MGAYLRILHGRRIAQLPYTPIFPSIEWSCLVGEGTWDRCLNGCQRLSANYTSHSRFSWRVIWGAHLPAAKEVLPSFPLASLAPESKSDWWRLDHVSLLQGSPGKQVTGTFSTEGGKSLLRYRSKQMSVKYAKHLAQCPVCNRLWMDGSWIPH